MKSAECFYRTRNAQIQYIGDKCRVSVRFSVVGVHCHSLVLLPLAVTEHINGRVLHTSNEVYYPLPHIRLFRLVRGDLLFLCHAARHPSGRRDGSEFTVCRLVGVCGWCSVLPPAILPPVSFRRFAGFGAVDVGVGELGGERGASWDAMMATGDGSELLRVVPFCIARLRSIGRDGRQESLLL